ncbi:MAG: hypothetical protein IPQ07_06150 [Myxococcales bacterium]|nr:hypothetical protein [Myxococcales bacterium]
MVAATNHRPRRCAGSPSSPRRRSLIILASDLVDPGDETLGLLAQLRAQHHDVSVLHILDPHETTFPHDGLTQFESPETTNKMLVNLIAIRRDYLARMQAFLTCCKSTLTGAGVDYHFTTTDRPLETTLLDLLVA